MILSINTCHHCQLRPIGFSHMQNRCQLHQHAADSALTRGCSFISQEIWNKIFIALAILRKCIMIEQLEVGMWSPYIHISGWHTIHFGYFSSLIVTGWRWWHRWHDGRRECRFGWRCTCAFAPHSCPWILCWATVSRNAAVREMIMNHSRVSFYRSLHLVMLWSHNTRLLLFSDFGARFHDEILPFLNRSAWNPSCGHVSHVHGKAHVGLF